jgi:signal transduction histidine kinase
VRELLARVRTHLELADARRTAAEYHMMDAFLGIVAHELRTPVTTLKIVWQSLQRAFGESGSPLATRLKTLGRAVGRIEVLIEDIVSVAAIKSGQFNLKLVPYDLTAICREGADEQATSSSLPVVLDLPEEPVVALVDDVRILEIVTNLLSNARKFSPPDRPVVLSLRRIGDEAHIAVRDEGPGIPRDELPHLFDRFHRIPGIRVQSGSQTGLGLGLYICKGIVEQHHGRIWAETAVGRGSTFHVVLPIKLAISESVAGAAPTGDAHNADLSP